jgi:hypothetical protein
MAGVLIVEREQAAEDNYVAEETAPKQISWAGGVI